MKFVNVLAAIALAVVIGAGWMQIVHKLDSLEQQVRLIESRPLSLQDDTKRRLEDLCENVAGDSAAKTHKVLEGRLSKCCGDFAAAVRESQNYAALLTGAVSNDLVKACREVQSQMTRCVLETEKAISEFAHLSKDKRDAYLAEARKDTYDDEVRGLLYRAAIMLSEDRQPLLSEYAKWCQGLVKRHVSEGHADVAERQYLSLVSFFDSVIGTGSVADICSIPLLTQQLAEVGELVDAARQKYENEQFAALDEIEGLVMAATNYDQCVECREKLEAAVLPEESADRLDGLLTLKMSTVMPASAPLIIPQVGSNTPWIAWLDNFKTRLKDEELDLETKAVDFDQAGEFLASAKKVDDAAVANAVEEIEKLGVSICRDVWRKTVLSATEKSGHSQEGVRQCAELLAKADEFSEEEQCLCRDELVALHRAVTAASIRGIRQQADSMKELESKLSADEYQQLLSMVQGQCLQMLIGFQELNRKFHGGFEEDIDRVAVAVSGFSSVMSGYRKTLETDAIKAQKKCEQKFLAWVRAQIEDAEKHYNEGEKKADEWIATTSNPEAQFRYKQAWETIIKVNKGDLSSCDEQLCKLWDKVKNKIESRYTPNDEDLGNRTYRGVDSFR